MPSIPKKVVDRFSKELGKFQRILKNAKDRDLNEADTVDIVNDILGSIFGFDKYTETTRELAIRNTYCDIAIKLNGDIKFLIEVKAVGLNLKENHLRQAVTYGATQGVRWVVLTNGVEWEIHRIVLDDRVNSDLVGNFNFLEMNARKIEDQERLFLLCKEGLSKDAIEEYHEHQKIVNRFSIGAVILEGPVTDVIRRELKKLSSGLRVENPEIASIVKNEILKREVVEGQNAKQAMSHYRRAAKKLKKKKVGVKDKISDNKTETSKSFEMEPSTTGIGNHADSSLRSD